MLLPTTNVLHLTSALSAVACSARCGCFLYFLHAMLCPALQVRSGTSWTILRWFQLPLPWLVPLLFLHCTHATCLRQSFYILIPFLFPSSSNLFPEISLSVNWRDCFSVPCIVFGLLIGMVLSVLTCRFHNMVTLRVYHHHHHHHYHHPLSLQHSISAGSQNSASFTDQALVIHCSTKNFLTLTAWIKYCCFLHYIVYSWAGIDWF